MNSYYSNSKGNVLVVGLVFILVLTVLGVGSMQSSNLEYRMSTNTAFKKQTFEYSESGRSSVSQVLDPHIFGRGWTGVNTPSGLDVLDNDGTTGIDLIYENEPSELVTAPEDDADFYIDFDGDSNNDADEKVAGVSVYEIKSDIAVGTSAGTASGYSGAGKGLGNSGLHMFFQVVSSGEGSGESRSGVATDFRYVVR